MTDELGNDFRIKIRNISASGLLAETEQALAVGDQVVVRLGNDVQVRASVAWGAPPRFGLQFHQEIDPSAARRQVCYAPRPFTSQAEAALKRRI